MQWPYRWWMMGSIAVVELSTQIIRLRIMHYEANPALLVLDAESAEKLAEWGLELLGVVEGLVTLLKEAKGDEK